MTNPLINFILFSKIDFILSTCPTIPDSTWIAAGRCIDYVTGFSTKLLSAGFITQLLSSGLSDSTSGKFDVASVLKLIGKILILLLFLFYSKRIFSTWEVFMGKLYPHARDVLNGLDQTNIKFPASVLIQASRQ